MDSTAVWQAVQAWPAEERRALAARIQAELEAIDFAPEIDEELAAELDRRLARHEADPANVRTWEQIMERIRRSRS